MSFLKLTDSQIAWVVRLVAAYVAEQREIYTRRAVPLNTSQLQALKPFFSISTLDSVRVIALSGERIDSPRFYGDLARIGFDCSTLPDFARMAAITFIDTVVSHERLTDRLLFHELVHVVQYEKLGLEGFAAKYVTGFLKGGSYEAIPLEMNAYDLGARFEGTPAIPFSVDSEVQQLIEAKRF